MIASPYISWLASLAILLLNFKSLYAQDRYTLSYVDSTKHIVHIEIEPAKPLTTPITFIMPRGIPGQYSIVEYDRYVMKVEAETANGKVVTMSKSPLFAPRWTLSDSALSIKKLRYDVDLGKMEKHEFDPSRTSITRSGYVGMLNYSVFGWIDGREKERVSCSVQTYSHWPVYSTIDPKEAPIKGSFKFSCDSYYRLADGQTVMGPAFQVKCFPGQTPAYVVSYAEGTKEYLDDIGGLTQQAISILKAYFGELPFQHYSVVRQYYKSVDEDHAGSNAMEHLNSGTFYGDVSLAFTKPMDSLQRRRHLMFVMHHMAHAYIPLRLPSDRYRPHVEELAPVINSIWFNEGFGQFICFDTLSRQSGNRPVLFEKIMNGADNFIRSLTLQELTQIGSTQYALDFRFGQALYTRGAFMAREMDLYIRKMTGNKKTMRDALRYLYRWSQQNKRPFTLKEFPTLLKEGTGVDVSGIYEKWQKPLSDQKFTW